MTRTDTSTWMQSTRHLLEAGRSKLRSRRSSLFLLPASVALLNLVFCSLLEGPIKQDPTNGSLAIFLLTEGSAVLFCALAHLATTGSELLRKSLVMPVTSTARLAYAVTSSVRQPIVLALLLSDLFFLVILYHHSFMAVVILFLLAPLMFADILAITSLASAIAIRKSVPPTILVSCCFLGILAIVLMSLLSHSSGAIALLPPISWTVHGIIAASHGNIAPGFAGTGAGIVLLLLTGLLGRRFA